MIEMLKIDKEKFNVIAKILETNENGKVESLIPYHRRCLTMYISGKDTELYIRKGLKGYEVVRVALENQRIGTMSEVLSELKKISMEEGFNEIVVESVLTEAMRDFCYKHGFEKENKLGSDYDISNQCGLYGNYVLKIKSEL